MTHKSTLDTINNAHTKYPARLPPPSVGAVQAKAGRKQRARVREEEIKRERGGGRQKGVGGEKEHAREKKRERVCERERESVCERERERVCV